MNETCSQLMSRIVRTVSSPLFTAHAHSVHTRPVSGVQMSSSLDSLISRAKLVADKAKLDLERAQVRDALTSKEEWLSAAVAFDLKEDMERQKAAQAEEAQTQAALRLGLELDAREEDNSVKQKEMGSAYAQQLDKEIRLDAQLEEERQKLDSKFALELDKEMRHNTELEEANLQAGLQLGLEFDEYEDKQLAVMEAMDSKMANELSEELKRLAELEEKERENLIVKDYGAAIKLFDEIEKYEAALERQEKADFAFSQKLTSRENADTQKQVGITKPSALRNRLGILRRSISKVKRHKVQV